MGIDNKIRDEKLQYDINREAEISALWSGKIHKYEYLADEEILPSDQSRIIEQATRTCIIKYKTLIINNVIPYIHNILAGMWWMRIRLKILNKQMLKFYNTIFPQDLLEHFCDLYNQYINASLSNNYMHI